MKAKHIKRRAIPKKGLPKPKRHWRMQRAATRKHMTYTTRTRVRPTAED